MGHFVIGANRASQTMRAKAADVRWRGKLASPASRLALARCVRVRTDGNSRKAYSYAQNKVGEAMISSCVYLPLLFCAH